MGGYTRLSRLDIKNYTALPESLEREIITRLDEWVPQVEGVIIADQVPERNCGAITDRVREALAELAARYPQCIMAADSRMRIGEYRQIILKPNEHEAQRAVVPGHDGTVTLDQAQAAGLASRRAPVARCS